MPVIQVALPIPMRKTFDYQCNIDSIVHGCRVKVPFGPRTLIGVVVNVAKQGNTSERQLKDVLEVLDVTSLFDDNIWQMCQWLSQYYHHPVGEVLMTALPAALRKGESNLPKGIDYLTPIKVDDITCLGSAKKQRQLFLQICESDTPLSAVRMLFSDAVINGLIHKGLAQKSTIIPEVVDSVWEAKPIADKPLANVEQAVAISAIENASGRFQCLLIEGVTGSGKTEVYLQAIESVLAKQQQVLVLVPEIGLTPQTVSRFERRFGLSVGVLHSNMSDNERLRVWQESAQGKLAIVIGTRSAIFTPMKRPGMIIVDEEHDASYKQQDGLRYHARDLASVRAKHSQIPLVLGSATPSLESLNNALSGKYHHLQLTQRAGNAAMTRQNVMDITHQQLTSGISEGMYQRIEQHLADAGQVMIFINRRGYAPALLCHDCGHIETCHRCDKPFTVHKSAHRVQCHHCGAAKPLKLQCSQCHSTNIVTHGVGTEQLEQSLASRFNGYRVARIDSDSVRGKAKLLNTLEDINQGKYQVLIGTQILSKGHHFPNVTLVLIIDADGALFSADYRASEHLAQLITQLSGRAGRASKPGEMWLQTHQPQHPLLQDLINNGYGHFARYALSERKLANLPPFTFQALFRAQALKADDAFEFLHQVSVLLRYGNINIIGPLPSLMEKRQGQYRMQLILQSHNRSSLHAAIHAQIQSIENLPQARKVRWSIDIDPQDFM